MKKIFFKFFLFITLNFFKITASNIYDLTVIGHAEFNDGLGRISIGIIDILKENLKINYINSRNIIRRNEISNEIKSILKRDNQSLGKVIIFTDTVNNDHVLAQLNLDKNLKKIKLIYSMFETTKIPSAWVKKINLYFDAVIVPDEYLINVYLNSGVKKPIFVLPLGIYLNDFLKHKNIKKDSKTFTFGCLSSFDLRKNHPMLIKAFAEEFKNDPNVNLRINGRSFDFKNLNKYLSSLKCTNIFLTKYHLSWNDYIKFMSNIDCYVNISKGEGFSIPPREALAMKIPCILTNNTAQKTICKTGFVKSIESNILEQAKFPPGIYDGLDDLGSFFNCNILDVRKALREVYNNYAEYKKKAKLAKQWVKQYTWQNLKNKYLTLIRPKKVILGNSNEILQNCIVTNSKVLYEKYLSISH